MSPGQVLCLTGSFTQNPTISAAGVTITSVDDANPATVNGFFSVTEGAHRTVIDHLRWHLGSGNINQIYADGVAITYNEIYGDPGISTICLFLGSRTDGAADRPVIDHNRIHDCGASNLDHGIYGDETYDGLVTNNVVWNASGFGAQLYKRTVRTLYANNVFDGSGESGIIIAGDTAASDPSGCAYSHDNTITNNIFSFNAHYGVAHFWGCTAGDNNLVTGNCFWGNGSGDHDDVSGYTFAPDNLHADPLYRDRASHDYTLLPGSPCTGKGPH